MEDKQLVVSTWLKQFGEKRNVTLRLEDDGHCVIPCPDEINLVVEVPNNLHVPLLFLYIPLIQLPSDQQGQLTLNSAALTLSMFGLLTGGCHIAFDPRSNYLVLSYATSISDIDESIFQNMLDGMIEMAPVLRERLQEPSTSNLSLNHWHSHERFRKSSAAVNNL